jgi:hypothetical protein
MKSYYFEQKLNDVSRSIESVFLLWISSFSFHLLTEQKGDIVKGGEESSIAKIEL